MAELLHITGHSDQLAVNDDGDVVSVADVLALDPETSLSALQESQQSDFEAVRCRAEWSRRFGGTVTAAAMTAPGALDHVRSELKYGHVRNGDSLRPRWGK